MNLLYQQERRINKFENRLFFLFMLLVFFSFVLHLFEFHLY
ncbi:putative membrane protein [Bacteroides fragilis str. S24L15]|uniref:Membrane protein n=2 Tax=Bacteroides fragilis TaxID=817 RepID=A0AB73AG67_BACFG|nr:putative membrane protein [Bacteroides fragilis str. 3397 T10]EXZ47606.1 putative membrane protein [Bacteroides fragilis str. 3397 N2]EXZ52306.1 putative membrane protein [Bacteroides fragilis str. 3397 T14]EXZ66515.1 putative membrane protein [Bacteroides fragilis str. 3783N1-8]EXZ71687.1 putative membrane protein [Bacteroides fragilis str. 3976T8]EYA42222.1 putative membrane protein [Bacteroides fragilis str. 3397 N3]EYA69774.1 putative membrane protein [Bacteroides fragilis str. S24L15]